MDANFSSALQVSLDEIITYELQTQNITNAAIAVVVGQNIVWSKGFGLISENKDNPVTPATTFRVGSVSKLFTDFAIMRLVEASKISLDEPVSTYLPDFTPKNPFKTAITIRHLMCHSSGLIREPLIGHYFDDSEPSLSATVATLNQTTLVFEPGTQMKYSNAALAVLGRVIEVLTKQDFATHIEEDLLKNLGMKSSSFKKPSDTSNHSKGFMWAHDGRSEAAPTFELGESPAGCMYSNVLDLSKFLVTIFNAGKCGEYQIVKESTLNDMLVPQIANENRKGAIGFNYDDVEGLRIHGHGGAIYGQSTELRFQFTSQVGIVIACNKDFVNGILQRISLWCLTALVATQKSKPVPEYQYLYRPIPSEIQLSLQGSYESQDKTQQIELLYSGPKTIGLGKTTEPELKLWDSSYISPLRLHPKDQTLHTTLSLAGPQTIQFDNQKPNQIILRNVIFEKKKDTLPPPPNKDLIPYIGEYGPTFNTLFVLERNGALFLQIEWFFFESLKKISDDTFALEKSRLHSNETLTFEWDSTHSSVECLVLSGMRFPRRLKDISSTFTIVPIRPIEEIREEAKTRQPPKAQIIGEEKPIDLVHLKDLDPSIEYDLRYASTNNFMKTKFYLVEKAFLQRPAALALAEAHQKLQERGLGILVFDTYRPWSVTHCFWEATPLESRHFVANSATGSVHNRGCAADIGLYLRDTKEFVWFGGGFDEMSERSYADYIAGTSQERYYRRVLREAMEEVGFSVYIWEWWHFDYKDCIGYPICNDEIK